jgi:YidC/Oxa1 family membrane protein insertase
MDRNTVIALVLSAIVLLGWGYFTRPSDEQIERARQVRDSIQNVNNMRAAEALKIEQEKTTQLTLSDADSKKPTVSELPFGSFNQATEGENSFFELENEKMLLRISKRGGRPYTVRLKEFKTYDSLPLDIFNGDTTVFGLTFIAQNANQPIRTNNLFWEKSEQHKTDSTSTLKLKLAVEKEKYIEYIYTLKNNDYLVDFSVNIVNMADVIRSNYVTFDWSYMIPRSELSLKWERQRSTIYYKYLAGEIDYLSETSDDDKKLSEKVKWVGLKTHFFSTIVVAKEHLNEVQLKTRALTSDSHVKELSMSTYMPYSASAKESHNFSFYFGPNKIYQLESYNQGFEKMVPLGWGIFRWMNRYVIIPIFDFLNRFVGNYGIIILLLTIIIKLVLFPLTYKSYLSTAKMKVLKPEIDEINSKFPNREDAMKKQQAVMSLYKKAGVSPMGGCLPTLLQMPILIAMFTFFPSAFELRQEGFLWAADLSTYDSVLSLPFTIPFYGDHVSLFCLLMAITNIIYVKIGDQTAMASSSMPGMKTMMYMMPVMMLFIFNDYASGLSYYYFLSLVITIGQTMVFRNLVDDKALHAQIQANKAKPVKKSNFQKRLEEAAKKRGYQPKK